MVVQYFCLLLEQLQESSVCVFTHLFIFGCTKSLLLPVAFVQLLASWGYSCCGAWALELAGSGVVMLKLSSSVACGIFPDPGSNSCPLHWQVECQPRGHQGSPAHVHLYS